MATGVRWGRLPAMHDDSPSAWPMDRTAFDLPRDIAYLNAAYMAPQPRAVAEAGRAALARRDAPWDLTPPDFFEAPEGLRRRLGDLLGASAEAVALSPATSYGAATAVRFADLGPGREAVVCAGQFPSTALAVRDAAQRAGARVRTVDEPTSGPWTDAVLDAIGPSTALVAVEPCSWNDGRAMDVAAVTAAAHAVGAVVIVDVTQAAGAVDVAWGALGADAVVGSTYKWLLGPTSLAFAVIDPRWWDAQPLEGPWLSRADGADFAGLGWMDNGFAPGARRFDAGGASAMVLGPMACAALDLLAGWGRSRVAEAIADRAAAVVEVFVAAGFEPLPAGDRMAHLVGLTTPSGDAAGVAEALRSHGVVVSVRGTWLRVSPHVWVDDTDLARLEAALAAMAR